jgi:cation diffusion facilitator family transporter
MPATHTHRFELGHEREAERKAWIIVGLNGAMMAAEIVAGIAFNSMALAADGWHMGTHVAAFALTGMVYGFQRRHAENPNFAFGPGKIGSLAGFSSAIVLAIVALLMIWYSGLRLAEPEPIAFDLALVVAAAGLFVNVLSAWILSDATAPGSKARSGGGAGHNHDHHRHGARNHHRHDHNLRSAYLHVLADALTSVTAIIALLAGRFLGWIWMDPVTGILGALVIIYWCKGLILESGAALLDHGMEPEVATQVTRKLEADGSTDVTDIHVWKIAPGHEAAIVSLSARNPKPLAHYREIINAVRPFSHLTVEIHAIDERRNGGKSMSPAS